MTQKRVKKIMCKRYNLLKYLPRHNKCTKQTSTFFPIAHWFMNIPRGGTNFISFLILVNIKWSSTIVISRITSIIKHRKGITTQWKKQSENVTNIKNIDVIFCLPELSLNYKYIYSCIVECSTESTNNMISDRNLITFLVVDTKIPKHIIELGLRLYHWTMELIVN